MTQRVLGVKFILEGGQWLAAALFEDAARQVVSFWQTGHYRIKDIAVIGSETYAVPPGGVQWAVRLDGVLACHVFSPEEQTAPERPQQTIPGRPNGSGLFSQR